jgi:hypothetical protein
MTDHAASIASIPLWEVWKMQNEDGLEVFKVRNNLHGISHEIHLNNPKLTATQLCHMVESNNGIDDLSLPIIHIFGTFE